MNQKALLTGAGANVLGYVGAAAGMMVGIGALSRSLAPEWFGVYFLLMMLPSVLGSLDFGLNVQVTRSVARWRSGQAPIEEVNAVQTAYLALAAVIFVVGSLFFALFSDPLNHLLSLDAAAPAPGYWLLALTYASLSFANVSLIAVLKGDRRFGTCSVVISTASLVFALCMCLLRAFPVEHPLLVAMLVHVAIALTQLGVLGAIVRRGVPVALTSPSGVLRYRADILRFGRNVVSAKLLNAFTLNAMKAASSAFFGPVAAGHVGVGLAAGTKYHTLVFAVSEVLLPHFSSREGRHPDQTRRTLLLPSLVALGMSGLMFTLLVLFGQPLVTLWLGENAGGGAFHIIAAMVFAFVVQAPLPFFYQYVMGVGRPDIHLRQVAVIAGAWLVLFAVLRTLVAGIDALIWAYPAAFAVGLVTYTLTIRRLLAAQAFPAAAPHEDAAVAGPTIGK